jgi:hypothetical protein
MAIEPSIDDLRALAELRLSEARQLLAASYHSGAYYLAGYAIECGLKALIARGFRQGVIPSKRFVDRVHTHNLIELLNLSGLKADWDTDADASVDLKTSWTIVTAWDETARYQMVDPFKATAMVEAVGHHQFGVLTWLRQRW